MLKVFEAFAGIGSQTQALKNIGVEHEVVAIAEIDKYAIKSYEAIHGEVNNVGDITKINIEDLPDFDLFTYSFPCQDISLAGKQAGLDKGSETRSSLLWECERVIKEKRPKYLLLENVKNLVGKKHKQNFDEWLKVLDSLGYNNYWQVLNAKDYGVAQNRERVFVVSIRKDLKQDFKFPEKQPLNKCLKDYLEEYVDGKYYLNEDLQKTFKFNPSGSNIIGDTLSEGRKFRQNNLVYDIDKHAPTLTARDYKDPKRILEVGVIEGIKFKARSRVLDESGVCETICAACGMGGNTQPKIMNESYRIRKLTPLECWRLMGFDDESFYKAQKVNSNTQLYKQAGNSIVVNVLEVIFKELFKEDN